MGWRFPRESGALKAPPQALPPALKEKPRELLAQHDLGQPDQRPPVTLDETQSPNHELLPHRRTEKTRAIFPMALILFLMISLRTVVPPWGEKKTKQQHV